MNTKLIISLVVATLMIIWTGRVFFASMNGDVLWKQLASGFGFIVFAIFFVLTVLKVIKTGKSRQS
jgi:hypothetical protein